MVWLCKITFPSICLYNPSVDSFLVIFTLNERTEVVSYTQIIKLCFIAMIWKEEGL